MFRAGGRASFNLDEGEKGKKRGEKEDSARLISDLPSEMIMHSKRTNKSNVTNREKFIILIASLAQDDHGNWLK